MSFGNRYLTRGRISLLEVSSHKHGKFSFGYLVYRVPRVIVFGVVIVLVSSCSKTTIAKPVRSSNSDGAFVVSATNVLLLPPMDGGGGGWCMTTTPGLCSSRYSRPVRDPIIAETWFGQGPPALDEGVVLTTDKVAAVLINGIGPISTRPESVLPDHLRTAVVNLRARNVFTPISHLRFIALNSTGSVIPSGSIHPQLLFRAPSKMWRSPAVPPKGVCRLSTTALPSLVSVRGRVMTRFQSHRAIVGREFVSCISTEYLFKGRPIVAAVLVDASHPGSAKPAPLPAMQPLSGHAGVLGGPGIEGDTVARRIPGAWLVVAKGGNLSQRLTLLERLRAVIQT